MKATILWIEGKRADGPSFIPGLRKKGFHVEAVSTGAEALSMLPDVEPDLVVVNAASLRSTGKRICRSLRTQVNGMPIVVISGQQRDMPVAMDLCANVVLHQPFTIRKLVNRIVTLLPAVSDSPFKVGPIHLDIDRKRVRCQGREARLTPRQALLLQILMQHKGAVLERERLFREVWNTEYTADTRTLDVHISWLREAIEEDPRHPVFLKTVRGVGYRLDV
jgi:DNA-binding response OmpR family regulator